MIYKSHFSSFSEAQDFVRRMGDLIKIINVQHTTYIMAVQERGYIVFYYQSDKE